VGRLGQPRPQSGTTASAIPFFLSIGHMLSQPTERGLSMNPVEELGQWVVVTAGGQKQRFPTNAAAWRWIDRHEGETISRSEAVSEWIWKRRAQMDGAKPRSGWDSFPNLHRRPPSPNLGRGRLQRQIARAFHAHGDVVSATDIYRWCQRWQSSRFGMPERWSIVRILTARCERVGRASTIGRPWLWRLKAPVADGVSVASD
jgi:hypothetical protein